MDRFFCHRCGFTQNGFLRDANSSGLICPQCRAQLKVEKNVQVELPAVARSAEKPVASGLSSLREYKIQFNGTAGEYFKIWIVNLFLSVITVGIYAAWAKVRTRRYFYANTHLDGHAFDYVANPIAILKGNLIVAIGLISYFLAEAYNPMASGGVLVAFYVTVPFLIYKSLQFFARNSLYRNIRFQFHGSLKESYKIYLLIPALFPFTFGLVYPLWVFMRKKFFFNSIAFGTTASSFKASPGTFYKHYLAAGLLLLVLGAGAIYYMGFLFNGVLPQGNLTDADSTHVPRIMLMGIGVYALLLLCFSAMQQFLYSRITNTSWNSSVMGRIRFRCSIKANELIWIRVTNIVAIIGSCGLLIPWAKVRRMRYLLSNLLLLTDGGLDDFLADRNPEVGALGEAATDFFDIDVGL